MKYSVLALLAALLCLAPHAGPRSQQFDHDLQQAVAGLDAARGPETYAALRRMWGTWNHADPAHVEEALLARVAERTPVCAGPRLRQPAGSLRAEPPGRPARRARPDQAARLRRPLACRGPLRQRRQERARHAARARARFRQGHRAGPGLFRQAAARSLAPGAGRLPVRVAGHRRAGPADRKGLRLRDDLREGRQGLARAAAHQRVGRHLRRVQAVLERRAGARGQGVPWPRRRSHGGHARARARARTT